MSVEELRIEYKRRFEEYRRKKVELERKIRLLRDDKEKIERYIEEVRRGAPKLRIEEIGKEFGVEIRDTFVGRMMLLRLLRESMRRVDAGLQDVERELRRIDKYLRDGIICPVCRGLGRLTKSRIERMERIVKEVLEVEECPLCGGSGRIRDC